MNINTKDLPEFTSTTIRQDIAPNTFAHLFQSAASTFNAEPSTKICQTNALSTALNLRRVQTEKRYKIKADGHIKSVLSCPSCGTLWMPGVNVIVRLVTYNTQKQKNQLVFENEHTNIETDERNTNALHTKRLSKRARKRHSLKMSKKKEALDHKLTNKLGLDPSYVASRSKTTQKKQKLVSYGCQMCHVHHIMTDDISNLFSNVPIKPNTVRVKISENKNSKPNEGLNEPSQGNNQKLPLLVNTTQDSKPTNAISASKNMMGIRKDKPKSKQKNALQKLLAKQKESKAQQSSSSGLGLLGLISKK